jgi:Fe-S-cluster-containing dehydrogenase component/CRP-like cAMP-binding protein
MQRPQRWDEPLDPAMTDADASGLLATNPFSKMDHESFAKSIPLKGILRNDCKIHHLKRGDIIVREGDYGNSAFLIIEGQAIVSLKRLPAELLGRGQKQQKGWLEAISQLWTNSKHAEARDYSEGSNTVSNQVGSREDASGTHIFLHDIPRVIPAESSVTLEKGEVFGEISALTRTPRSATVVSANDSVILEIRWQGFRELLKRNDAMRAHVEGLYRENSLRSHLREVDILKNTSSEVLDRLVAETTFESFGNFQWNQKFKSTLKKDISQRILSEPLIAEQGSYTDGLILIRNGFARLSRVHGDGHQTITYLGKGQSFGLRELTHNWKTGEQRPWMLSLRAVGYVDILRIPTALMEQHVLPTIAPADLPPALPTTESKGQKRRLESRKESMDSGLMEFLVEKRLINGTQAMMIDLDRCTRCDDCVRACASTHDNNPRFNRQGETYNHWMITNACMHCLDPVCMIGCPTGAIGRDEETGNVTINDNTCIGCSTCSNSCPYDNIQMVAINDRKGLPIVDKVNGDPILKATKCDLCSEQLGGPACQRACPHDALIRIDLSTPDSVTAWTKR